MVRTRCIAGYAETTDYLPVTVERNAAAERNDTANRRPVTASLRVELGIERV
jgi:hypothetical protein